MNAIRRSAMPLRPAYAADPYRECAETFRQRCEWPLFARIDPQTPGFCAAASRIEYRDRRVTSEEMVGSKHFSAEFFVQGSEPPARTANPTGESRPFNLDTMACEDLRLPVRPAKSGTPQIVLLQGRADRDLLPEAREAKHKTLERLRAPDDVTIPPAGSQERMIE
jgi:hypothetical protein